MSSAHPRCGLGRRTGTVCLLAAAWLGLGCGSTIEVAPDGPSDAQTPRPDGGPPAQDDAGLPTSDAGPPTSDAGTPAQDDAGTPAQDDAGTPAQDDAGPPGQQDAAVPVPLGGYVGTWLGDTGSPYYASWSEHWTAFVAAMGGRTPTVVGLPGVPYPAADPDQWPIQSNYNIANWPAVLPKSTIPLLTIWYGVHAHRARRHVSAVGSAARVLRARRWSVPE